MSLWRGEALSGLGGSVFEAARARLADARASAWETWAEIGVEQGRAGTLIPELTRLTEEFPLREGLRTQLMLALHQAGRQAEALAVFRDAREYFLDEFGAEPGERMREAHRRILRSVPAPPPDPAPVSPPPLTPPPLTPPPAAVPLPAAPLFHPPKPRRRISAAEVIFALLAPFATCLVGSWFYFAYTGARRRQVRYFVITVGYIAVWIVGVLLFTLGDPGSLDSDETSPVQGTGLAILLLLPLFAATHGLLVALHAGEFYYKRTMRDQARQFVIFAPDRAREVGIGRPDLPLRSVDDGGLVDLNHLGGYELAAATGLPVAGALAIVADRAANGPFTRPEELVSRGLADERTVKKLAPRLVCVPPGPYPVAWPPR